MISIRQKIPTTTRQGPKTRHHKSGEEERSFATLRMTIVVAAVRRGKGSALRWCVLLTTETQELGGVSTRRPKVSLR